MLDLLQLPLWGLLWFETRRPRCLDRDIHHPPLGI